MKADLRMIRLNRKIIRDQECRMAADDEAEALSFFATDYFDSINVETREISDDFTSIMGIWPDERIYADDIAVQSFSLYCSERMLERHLTELKSGDPFSEAQFPFLSIIQIHITPEILAHVSVEKAPDEFMNLVFEDLIQTMHLYINQYPSVSMVFRIYRMLSTGDFSIVIRSGYAETSFQISSLLRKRKAGKRDEKSKKLVLYKTYTLLSIDEFVLENDTVGMKGTEDRFVLRCCYSNLYWSQKEEVEKYLLDKQFLPQHELFGLNGRYDFSVQLSEDEFIAVFPYIAEYKKDGHSEKAKKFSGTADSNIVNIVEYMKFLLEHKYLSYVNERYLVASGGRECDLAGAEAEYSSCLVVSSGAVTKREDFMDYKIAEYCLKVLDKYKKIREKLNKIRRYRKNLKHYMNLLQKLVILCQGINGLSDTRVYAIVLLEQLDIVLDAINIYTELLAETDEDAMVMELLDSYVREAVCALDVYAQYIRNNNLQSLQTPNYNIESNTSMEKILIGYSELLSVFLNFYLENHPSKLQNETNEIPHLYLPVVVPELNAQDVSVEILFREGVIDQWDKELEIRKRFLSKKADYCKKDRFCMVIRIPTLTELGNVVTMVPSLFHEIAHQFRYELRTTRNDTLLQFVIHHIIHILVRNLIDSVQKKIGRYDISRNAADDLEVHFVEAFMETNYKNEKGEFDYQDRFAPLDVFCPHLKADLGKYLSYAGQKEEILLAGREYIKRVSFYHEAEDTIANQRIELLYTKLKELQKGLNETEFKKTIHSVVKCSFGVIWECACYVAGVSKEAPWKEGFDDWVNDDSDIVYNDEWNVFLGEDCSKFDAEISQLWNSFWFFSTWLYDRIWNDELNWMFESNARDNFIKNAYSRICKWWKQNEVKAGYRNDLLGDPNSNYEAIGRALGIDVECDSNLKQFKAFIIDEIEKRRDAMIECAEHLIRCYREETADIMMCSIMQLSPLGYLNVLAVNWPGDFYLSNEHLDRALNVLVFCWCLSEDSEGKLKPDYSCFQQTIVCLLNELKQAVTTAVSFEEQANSYNSEMQSQMDVCQFRWEEDGEASTLFLLEQIEKFLDLCDSIYYSETNDYKKNHHMKYYMMIGQRVLQLIEYSREHFYYLEDYEELTEDYIRGIINFKSLNEKMIASEDIQVKRLSKFCSNISRILNHPSLSMGNQDAYADLCKQCMEFLFDMYYSNKRRNAQSFGGNETDGN